MKYLILVSLFFVASYGAAYSQGKKIDINAIYSSVDFWYFCKSDNGIYDDKCVEKVKIKFTNDSESHLSKIIFKLKITVDGVTIYKKQHTINVDIDAGETVPYDVKLFGKATGNDKTYLDFRDEIEIISVK